jgi:hypothetical protein
VASGAAESDEHKLFMRLELRQSLQTLLATAGNGRLGGLKTALRMEVARACEADVVDVEILRLFEKPATPDGQAAATVSDIMITATRGWNRSADLTRMASALMDQVDRNRSASDSSTATLMECVRSAEIRDHTLLPSRAHHQRAWLLLLLILMAHYSGVLAFAPQLRLPLSASSATTTQLRSQRRRASPELAMQAQSAVVDAPRFQDVTAALAGVVTRAERQALIFTSKAARFAPLPVDHQPARFDAPSRHREGEIPLGEGVFLKGETGIDRCVTLQPRVQAAVERIHRAATQAALAPWASRKELVWGEEEIAGIRGDAERGYVEGQRIMSSLGHVLARRVMGGEFECRSTVTAGTPLGDVEEFRLSKEYSTEDLRGSGSLELAQRQLQGLHVEDGAEWKGARVIDHELEFDALRANDRGVAKVIAHARPYAEMWRLICDRALFSVVEPERASMPESMFQVKILVETQRQADELAGKMRRLHFSEGELREIGVPVSRAAQEVRCLSSKGGATQVEWCGSKMVIKVVTLDEHYVSSELSSRAARARQEAARESHHQQLESHVPLYRFTRDTLHWLLASSSLRHAPSCDRVSLKIVNCRNSSPE